MNYCRNLNFDQKPDYQYLRGLFRRVLEKNVPLGMGAYG